MLLLLANMYVVYCDQLADFNTTWLMHKDLYSYRMVKCKAEIHTHTQCNDSLHHSWVKS